MYRFVFILFIALLISGSLFAQNHMDIMTTMSGERNYSKMGFVMTTLDWNGDGHDDLVVSSNNWKPVEYQSDPYIMPFGKLYFYMGGSSFDNAPEMVIPGSYQNEYRLTTSMCNAGDMNADGFDDLALFRATMYEGTSTSHYDLQLCIFYGGVNPDTIPDYILTFPREEWSNTYCFVRGLGDINHDGHDELGYILNNKINTDQGRIGIIQGENHENVVFRDLDDTRESIDVVGLGDVNFDGIDDFCLGYGYGPWENLYHRVVLFFGNSTGTYNDSLVICDNSEIISAFSYPAGDINWDGYPDFVSSYSSSGAKIYFGGPGFDGTQNVTFNPPYNGAWNGEGFAHGDVNGNGTDDLMGTFVTQADGYGDAYLWMGGVPMNGITDLHITPPSLPWPVMIDAEMFGFCLTMGDYNADGYCDAAISAPFDYGGGDGSLGYVFVYAGNPLLNDPTHVIDDNTPIASKMQLFPNPLQPSKENLNVKFITPLNPPSGRGVESSTFEIYNIRGQKVKSFIITAEQTKAGAASFNLPDLPTGVYFCIFANGNLQLKEKITIVR
ncbi:MAG TPA: FG-GAP-like repeat-containing protein [Candidatus Cloacimonadota bacterium]|nr:FG-GAP-like repeat-containing protein [Candidatus Cloacimonadota bacterium]